MPSTLQQMHSSNTQIIQISLHHLSISTERDPTSYKTTQQPQFYQPTDFSFLTSNDKDPNHCQTIYGWTQQSLVHQRFDHRSMDRILKMKEREMMNGLPANITNFHNEYSCPIYLLTKATRMKQHKNIPTKLPHKKGDYLCMDYSFWNKTSIRGFTSLLSVICLNTRFSFAFPTRHKRPPLVTISLNGLVERPNCTIAEAVRAKLTNSGRQDNFWCFVAEDTVFKQRRTLHTAIGTTPYKAWFNRIHKT